MRNLLILLALFLVSPPVSALPSFDPFAGPVGAPLAGQTDSFGNLWGSLGANFPGPEPVIVAGNLSYPGLLPSTGNSVSFVPAASMSARLDLQTNGNSGTFYYSFILKITDISAVPDYATNNAFVGFSDTAGSQPQQLARLGTRLLAKKSGAGYVLGLGRNNALGDYAYATTVRNVNDVLFVIGSYEMVGGLTNVNLWINPPSSTFGSNAAPAPTLSVPTMSSTGGALNANGVRAFVILCQNPSAPSGIIDDLRVGKTWTYVTGDDPAIVAPPPSQTLPPGVTASFAVEARGTPPLTYQWIKDGTIVLTDAGNVSGSTTSNLILAAISPGDAGSYSVMVTNGSGNSVTSRPAILTVVDPAIVTPPQNRTDDYGATASFTVTAVGTGPLSYQWQKNDAGLSNGGNISGATTSNLTVSGVSYLDAGGYSVIVTNGNGNSVTSAVATLTVRDPVITSPPVNRTNVTGTTATFSVAAAGTPTITYQWRHENTLLVDGGNISGATTDTLTLSNAIPADAGNYAAVASGSASGLSMTSGPAILTINDPVAISAQPVSRIVVVGDKVSIAVGVTGTAPAYQWWHNNAPIPGATLASHTVASAQTSNAGNYFVVVTNALHSVTSNPAILTVLASAPRLYETNLIVIRVGDGAQALTANGNSIFVDQFARNGTYLSTVTIPDTGPSAMITMGPNQVSQPSSVTGTSLSRSADWRYMVVAGYNTAAGFGASLNTSTSAGVPRGIGFIDSLAQYSLSLSSTDTTFSATFWRSAVADGTNNFWGAGRTPGTYYFGFDAAPALVQSVFSNLRSMALFNGSIYCVSAVGGNNGVLKLDGMPQTPAAANPTVLLDTSIGTSTGSSDLEVSPNGNLIYVADDRNAPSGGIQRYEFNGSTWSLVYTLTDGLLSGARYVTTDFSGANPIVYAVTKEATEDNNRLVRIEDTGAASVGTTLSWSGANQNFRGIRFGPVQSTAVLPPTLSFSRDGSNLILDWSGVFILQSATNVVGPYGDVSGAISPYTNSTSAEAQSFFRLRN